MTNERRILRSTTPGDALRIFLARNATDAAIRAVAVSDDDGLLLSGVGGDDLDLLAAIGAVVVDRDEAEGTEVCWSVGLDRADVHARKLEVGGHTFVVTSLGAPLAAADGVGEVLERLLAA